MKHVVGPAEMDWFDLNVPWKYGIGDRIRLDSYHR